MVFSDTSLKNGILQTCELLLDLGDGGITGDSTLKAQFTNLVNIACDDVISEIMRNQGEWNWDDIAYGNSNLPVKTIDLTTTAGSEVSAYAIPAAGSPGSTSIDSFLRLNKAYIKDAGGKYQMLRPISDRDSDIPLETLFYNPGFPQWYRLVGNSIILYPAPLAASVTATAGLKLEYQRDSVDFVVGDTTKSLGFSAIHHPLVPYFASEAWAAIKGLQQLGYIQKQIQKMYTNLGWNVANRNKDLPQRLASAGARRNRNYE